MNRKYTIEEFVDKINKIRTIRPNMNFTTDLIVGFPTETDEDFKETINNLKLIKFSKIHTFPYSIRNNTPAATMKQVNDSIKKERVHQVLELSNVLENEYYNKFLNQSMDCLIEETKDGISIGHTDNYIKIEIEDTLENNKFYKVKIDKIVNTQVKGITKS